MPHKKRAGKKSREIEPYQSTAEIMLKMIHESDRWLINNYKTSLIAWTILVLANTMMASIIWIVFGITSLYSIIMIFVVGVVWGAYMFALYQTKQKIEAIKSQMRILKQREEDFLKRF